MNKPTFATAAGCFSRISVKCIFLLITGLLLFTHAVNAQKVLVDSLTTAYQKNPQDTTMVKLLLEKALTVFLTTNADSGMSCLNRSLALSRKIHYKAGEVRSLVSIATYVERRGDLPGAIKQTYEVIPKAIEIKNDKVLAQCYNTLGLAFATLKDYKKSMYYLYMSKNISDRRNINDFRVIEDNNLSRNYLDMNRLDSAQYFTQMAYDVAVKTDNVKNIGYLIRNFGTIQVMKHNYAKGIAFYRKSITTVPLRDNHYLLSEDYRRMAEAFRSLRRNDSCIFYAKKAYDQAILDKDPELEMKAAELLTSVNKSLNNYKEALENEHLMLTARDSLFSQQKALQIQNLTFTEEQRRREIEAARVAYQNKVRFYSLLSILGVVLLIAFILLFANGQRRKANRVLRQRNEQIETQHKALEKTLAELKTTQSQLIQSEKMASLGELTAGIAHEIQNPLNFVNNFSEVNVELIDELQLEIDKANYQDVKAIADDIKANEQKINMHGKRADFVVKGMLQHSRPSTGEKQLTDINVLADEFLKLSYHGLRAKDKSFHAHLVTHFDHDLPKIHVAQQDLGRVMVNFFSNAFFAIAEKKKLSGDGFEPQVTVGTKNIGDKIVFSVRDNGNGVSPKILDKIFQPFFTTKPTGQGTGLGLSLSYDIIKAHGGEIQLETKEGEFTEFIVYLPAV